MFMLPQKSVTSLGFITVAQICLGYGLDPRPGRPLVLTNDPRTFVYYQNGLANARFVSSVWANA